MKEMNEKQKAHMYYKRLMASMKVTNEQMELIKKYYPFMRGGE